VALITLSWDTVSMWAKDQGLQLNSAKEASEHPKVKDLIRRAVADANAQLAPFETIKHFAILPNDFTIESGELTPSLKIKRKIVDERYMGVINALY
jgi:long-chain acyl-CoA synthetase